MTTILAQLRRELSAFFVSPIAYVLLGASMLLNGIVFLLIVQFLSNPAAPHGAAMQMLFGGTIFYWISVIVFAPLVTMRSLAEEKHLGTLETLLTAPINEAQVVLAKYAAAVIVYVALWAPTLLYPALLSRWSTLDLGPIAAGYLGTLGVGLMFTAVGLLASALTRNQIVAALISFGGIMVLFLIGVFDLVNTSGPSPVLGYLNLWSHMEDFGRGIVDTRHLVYYGSVTVFLLFATVQVLQMRRWRG